MDRYEIRVTESADRDIGELFEYVAGRLHAPMAASDLVTKLYDAIKSLSKMPRRFPLSRDAYLAGQGFHTLLVDNYMVFYVVDEGTKTVIVHRVLYSKRKFNKLFIRDESEPES